MSGLYMVYLNSGVIGRDLTKREALFLVRVTISRTKSGKAPLLKAGHVYALTITPGEFMR